MGPEASAAELVAHIDAEVDGIDGLITVTAHEERIVGLVTSHSKLRAVRQELVALGVRDEMMDLQVIDEAELPYPVTDDRLRRWLEGAEQEGAVDAAVTVKGPNVGMTPRGIGKAVVFLVIGGLVLSMLMFIGLMIFS